MGATFLTGEVGVTDKQEEAGIIDVVIGVRVVTPSLESTQTHGSLI